MRCPRCSQENPEEGKFCIHCGYPLTPYAETVQLPLQGETQKSKRYSVGGFLAGLGKAICYVILFFVIQSAVIGVYSANYTISQIGPLLSGGMLVDDFMMEIMDDLLQAVYENLTLLTLISGALTILFLALFFTLRHKNFFAECRMQPVAPLQLLFCALIGTALNIFISVTIGFLPLPEAWFEGLDQQYAFIGQGNLLLEFLSTALMTGLVEEVIFRGLSESRLRRGAPLWLAVLLSALLFGICHGTPIAVGYATGLGILLSLLNLRSHSLLPSIVCHIFFNATAIWFVTEDPLLVIAAYIIAIAILAGSLFLYFRRNEEPQDPSVSHEES